jgi:hypothetical protein
MARDPLVTLPPEIWLEIMMEPNMDAEGVACLSAASGVSL